MFELSNDLGDVGPDGKSVTPTASPAPAAVAVEIGIDATEAHRFEILAIYGSIFIIGSSNAIALIAGNSRCDRRSGVGVADEN